MNREKDREGQREGRKDGNILFHRTYPAPPGNKISKHQNVN